MKLTAMRPTDARRPPPPTDATVVTVSELNREARRLLERGLPGLWVAGEISNLARPRSGHIYFSLKDAHAQVRCAMFRNAQRGLTFTPQDGTQVVLSGTVSIYEARGDYQIIVSHMEEAGAGALQRQFDELKARLDALGLFAEEHKRPLPELPARVGVVTSPTAAALRDILNVLKRRYPLAEVIVYPTHVQGERAANEIVDALAAANRRRECDVIILARGGGSLEDLWPFNTEPVAQAIFASKLPVVAGIGHEVDVTIADLVADVRAPTPSGAAELVVPDVAGLQRALRQFERRALLATRGRIQAARSRQRQLTERLQRNHPQAVLQQLQQRSDELTRRLQQQMHRDLQSRQAQFDTLAARLRRARPAARIALLKARQQQAAQRLVRALNNSLVARRQQLISAGRQLHAVSPLATLDRGYAIVLSADQVVRSADVLSIGQPVDIRLAQGRATAQVTAVEVPVAEDDN
ncbi:MAG: exodeoxyribonuclease VII large subunit [Gammaproteobacteria bacterium]|jgi:exodeoxyribonuclease VII large subunit|nr:exodeoxyribonuclease VII large subunit [Gammaproteobacteria bacterium]